MEVTVSTRPSLVIKAPEWRRQEPLDTSRPHRLLVQSCVGIVVIDAVPGDLVMSQIADIQTEHAGFHRTHPEKPLCSIRVNAKPE